MHAPLQGQGRHQRQMISAHRSQNLWSYYLNSSSNQMFAFTYNSALPSTTKRGRFIGTLKSVILEYEISVFISHPASYAREIHISVEGRTQIWIFSARKSNSPLKQSCELGDTFPGHWMRRRRSLITSPLSLTGHLTLFVGLCQKHCVWVRSTYKQINSTDPWNCRNCAYRDVTTCRGCKLSLHTTKGVLSVPRHTPISKK